MFRLFFTLFSITFFTNCTSKEVQNSVDAELTRSLELSNDVIKKSTQNYYKEFYKNLSDSRFYESSSRWKPKIDSLKFLSDSLVNFTERLMTPVKNAIKNNSIGNPDLVNSEDIKKLLGNIIQYESLVLNLDNEIRIVFKNRKTKISNNIDTAHNSFDKKYFTNKTAYKQLLILNKFKNDIYTFENELIAFCQNRSMPIIESFYESFGVIIGQSSNVVKKGDIIEITAGVGAFSRAAAPKIVINNKVSLINESAFATHKIKTQYKAGHYTVPVEIEYTKPDGTKAKNNYSLEYTVKD